MPAAVQGVHFFQSRLHFGEGLNDALRRRPATIQPILQVVYRICGWNAVQWWQSPPAGHDAGPDITKCVRGR